LGWSELVDDSGFFPKVKGYVSSQYLLENNHKMQEMQLEKKLTANQLYKQYKDEGGTLIFSDWLNRENEQEYSL